MLTLDYPQIWQNQVTMDFHIEICYVYVDIIKYYNLNVNKNIKIIGERTQGWKNYST